MRKTAMVYLILYNCGMVQEVKRMGIVIDRRAYKLQRVMCAQALFVLENPKHLPTDVEIINLGLELSSLAKSVPREKLPSLTNVLEQLLSGKPTDIILDRIDILFDPVWNVDVLKLLLSVGRNRRLYIAWPGLMLGNILTYSEQGRPDWRACEINAYNDLFIIKK